MKPGDDVRKLRPLEVGDRVQDVRWEVGQHGSVVAVTTDRQGTIVFEVLLARYQGLRADVWTGTYYREELRALPRRKSKAKGVNP